MMSLSKKNDEVIDRIAPETESETSNLKFPCGICKNSVKHNHESILCDQCNKWIHIECNDISISEYKILQNEPVNKQLICLSCSIINNSSIFPFTLVTDSVFQETYDLSLTSNYQSNPSFEIASRLTNFPNLSDYDIDENINIEL